MPTFQVLTKLWPDGIDLGQGVHSSSFTIDPMHPNVQDETADEFMTSVDGTKTYQFLFWNTDRRLTNKRHVKWHFSVPGWNTWTATKWYGKSVGGGPGPRVRADAFSISANAPLSGTPIDKDASTYPAGAYPFAGPPEDDHAVGTGTGIVHVVAKDPFPFAGPSLGPTKLTVAKGPAQGNFPFGSLLFSYALSSYDFAGWLQLSWGGDGLGWFDESDALPGGSGSGFGIYDHVVGDVISAKAGVSLDLLATYGIGTHYVTYSAPIPEFIYKIPYPDLPWPPGASGPIWLKLFQEFMLNAQPGLPSPADFERFINDVPKMSPEELKRATQLLRATLDRGKIALSEIDAQLKRIGH